MIRVCLALVFLASPPVLLAQQPSASGQGSEAAGRSQHATQSGVQMLLRHRSDLGLTDGQIERLKAIAGELERQNRPLLRQLREAGIPVHGQGHLKVDKLTPEEEDQLRRRLKAHRPVLDQLRKNTQAAMGDAHRVLTSRQRDRLRAIMDAEARSMEIEDCDGIQFSPPKVSYDGD